MAVLLTAPTKNAVQKTLASQLLSTSTLGDPITFDDVDGIPNTPGVLVINRIDANGTATASKREYIEYSGTSGVTVLITTRNVDSSNAALTHAVGSIVEFIPDVTWADRIYDALSNVINVSTLAVDTTKVVTPTGTQTLTNKSIVLGGSNYFSSSGATISALDADGTLAGDSDLRLATQKATKTYVDSAVATISGGASDLFSNILVNGGFDIWQRNSTFTTPNDDTYGPDQWIFLSEANGAWTFSRDTDVPTGIGVRYSLKAANVTLNNQCAIVQIIEGVDAKKFAGKNVSLSFYAKTNSTEIANLRASVLSWDSTEDAVTSDVISSWASDGTDPTFATNWTKEVAGSNKALTSSWQRFTVENIAIDTASMNNIAVVIWVDDGTIAANDDLYITAIQLNEGATANTFKSNSFAYELDRCQRFYEKTFNYSVVPTNLNTQTHKYSVALVGTALAIAYIPFKVKKRNASSTVTYYSDNNASGVWAYFDNASAYVDFSSTANSTISDGAVMVGLTASGTPFALGEARLVTGHLTVDNTL